MWERIKGWMRSHWKTVAAVGLALVVAIVMGAICANPVGAPIVAALISIKAFAVLSPVVIPYVVAGLSAAAVLGASLLFNVATAISDWLDKRIDKKGPGAPGNDYLPLPSEQTERASTRTHRHPSAASTSSRTPEYFNGPFSGSHGHGTRTPEPFDVPAPAPASTASGSQPL